MLKHAVSAAYSIGSRDTDQVSGVAILCRTDRAGAEMAFESRTPAILRFDTFEVDVSARELRKQGVRIKIQEQPFQVLTLLLQRPGEVLTREELRTHIWQGETFVDFDNGLNTSINRLRDALGDSANNPLRRKKPQRDR